MSMVLLSTMEGKVYNWSNFILILIFSLFLVPSSFGKTVREITVNDSKMENVYLNLGKSTILRFQEKPQKIVIGNKNYFHLQFIQNDIAIQPLSNVSTNLFVYGEYRTYGFLLFPGTKDRSDDLVKIKWKNNFFKINDKQKLRKKHPTKFFKELNFSINNEVEIKLKKILRAVNHRFYIMDLELINKGSQNFNLLKTKWSMTSNGLTLNKQEVIKEKDILSKNQVSKIRVIFNSAIFKNIELVLINGEDNKKFRIPKEFFN
ncbi:MAG: hypothetical protein OEY33_09605 [Bdellovibrionales bacterium]|nr:hypothetical protein [Bdellovibrionales bacterium]